MGRIIAFSILALAFTSDAFAQTSMCTSIGQGMVHCDHLGGGWTDCNSVGGTMATCNTMGVPEQDDSPASANHGGGSTSVVSTIGDMIARGRESAVRKKVGAMLANGDCEGAARIAYQSGRLELGASIAQSCRPQRTVQSAPQPSAPLDLEGTLRQTAAAAKTPGQLDQGITVSKVEAVGTQLVLSAVVEGGASALPAPALVKARSAICTSGAKLLNAGATVRIIYYDANRREIGSITQNAKGCA